MAITKLAEILVSPITNLISEFVTDKDEANRLAHEIATMAAKHSHAEVMAQVEVNKVEATHASLFVAGWRPFIGWVCGFGFAMNFLFLPLGNFALAAFQVIGRDGNVIQIPMVDTATMMPVLMGMLGLGVYRTYEKAKGVSREASPKRRRRKDFE